MNNKAIIEFVFRLKNSADLGGCYPPRPSASVDNSLLDLQNSSYPTQPPIIPIIANYLHYLAKRCWKIKASKILNRPKIQASEIT